MTLEQINAQACDQAPIHCLPDEILGVIFLINTSKLVEQGNPYDPNPYDPHATTIATTQVCQRWRAVALDHSLLWGRIINYEEHSPSRIEMLLARSGSSLIDVGGDSVFEAVKLQNPRGKLVLRYIFQQITRLKTFSLHIRHDPWASICRSFLSHPAPNLEFLNLITSCPFPDCLYPGPLFTNVAPRLRRLHLQRCLIDFSSSVLSNLTELSVRDVLAPSMLSASEQTLKVAPSVAGWLRVLKNIPTLRFLTLSSAISHFTEPDPSPIVNLPYLTLLTISARFYQGMSLIDHLNIPTSCGIKFRLRRSRSTDGLDGLKLLSFLSKHLTHWSQDQSDRYLQAKVLSGDRIHFGNSSRIGQVLDITEWDEVEAHRRFSKDPILSLVLEFDPSQNSLSFFNQLLELYSFTFVTTTTLDLWLDQEFARTARTAGSFSSLHTFGYFTNVKTLNLLEQSPVHLLPLFQNSSLPDYPLFPALQSLCLTGTAMDPIVGVLVAFLQWRVAAGIPLSEINGGSISSQIVEQLSRLGNLRVIPSGLLDSSPLRHYVRETDAEDEI